MRSSILTAAIAVALITISLGAVASAQDASPPAAVLQKATHHKAHKRVVRQVVVRQVVAPNNNIAAELASRDHEIAELKSTVASLEGKVGELEQRTDAQSEINVGQAKTVETLQAEVPKVDKLTKLVNDTTVGGRAFIDITDINQKKNGTKTAANGVGLDVKRFYLTVNHQFDDIWSANLTTDFNYSAVDSETQLFIKYAYLQGKFSDAFVFRAGSAPMPWLPYAEGFYGMRYVDKTMVDRLGFGNTADWGVNVNGKIADNMVDYSASAVDGGGFKNPTRTKRMDFEGRVGFAPIQNTVIAIGGYSGDLGQDVQGTTALHTATRGDVLIAYAKDNTRIGAEYFQASNWKNVLMPLKDKADGYSLWGSWGFTDKFSVFGRYDHAKLSKDLDPSLTDKYFNLGLQWDVRKGLKVAAVYKNDNLKDTKNETKTDEFGIFGDVSF